MALQDAGQTLHGCLSESEQQSHRTVRSETSVQLQPSTAASHPTGVPHNTKPHTAQLSQRNDSDYGLPQTSQLFVADSSQPSSKVKASRHTCNGYNMHVTCHMCYTHAACALPKDSTAQAAEPSCISMHACRALEQLRVEVHNVERI